MSKWSDALRRVKVYQVVLHVVVLALAVEVFVLGKQNRELKSTANQQRQVDIKVGEHLSLDGLTPVTTSNAVDSTVRQLIYIFTTTCPFCEKNVAAWKEVNKAASRRRVRVLGICLDSPKNALAYAVKFRLSYEIYVPENVAKYRQGNHIVGVPNTVLRSSSGQAESVWLGLLGSDKVKEIVRTISDISLPSFTHRRQK
jgi:hypothetical protein